VKIIFAKNFWEILQGAYKIIIFDYPDIVVNKPTRKGVQENTEWYKG